MLMSHAFKIVCSNFVDFGGLAPIFGITEIACALICLRKDGCSSFFYHADEMNCGPSLTRYFNTTLLDHHNGYQYYIIRPDCDNGWELLNGRCYYFENIILKYVQAERNCLEKGGYLAKTDDDAENILFVSLSEARGSFWIGGKMVNGTWIWQDGSPLPDYWAQGEPNGAICIQQWDKGKGFDDNDCLYKKLSLCEKS